MAKRVSDAYWEDAGNRLEFYAAMERQRVRARTRAAVYMLAFTVSVFAVVVLLALAAGVR